MRKVIFLCCLSIFCFATAAQALTGISIGGKIGAAKYSGDILPGSGDVGSNPSYAVIVGFGGLPMLDLEIRGGYFKKDFDYEYLVAGVPVSAAFEYRDMSVTVLAKKGLVGASGFPFSIYAGAGLGWHWINTELAQDLAAGTLGPANADDPVNLFQNSAKLSGEGVAGVKVSLPAFPIEAFGEAKYGLIFASERLTLVEFAGGVMIRF